MTAAEQHLMFRRLLPAYALGCLEEEEADELIRHVATCDDCREELAEFEGVADALALAVADAVPSPALRRRLLAAARGPAAASSPPTRRKSAPRPLRMPRAWPVLAVLALAAVVLGGLLWAAVGLYRGDAQVVSLAPTEFAPDAGGELRMTRGGEAATLAVWGLPALPADRQYQLWLVRGEERDSGAIFSVDAGGRAETPVALPRPAADYDRFGITIEPAGGSPGPTGEGVLRSGGG